MLTLLLLLLLDKLELIGRHLTVRGIKTGETLSLSNGFIDVLSKNFGSITSRKCMNHSLSLHIGGNFRRASFEC